MNPQDKLEYMKGTAKIVEECRKETRPYIHNVLGHDFIVLPGVFSPKYFKDTEFFAKEVPKYVQRDFLEIGSGTGIVSCMVLVDSKKEFYASPISEKVVAVDINPEAIRNTFLNSLLILGIERYNFVNRGNKDEIPWNVNIRCSGCGEKFSGRIDFNSAFSVKTRIETRLGNIYDSTKFDKFDTIFWNVPFGDYDDGNVKEDVLKQAVFDPKHKNLEKFIAGAPRHLKEDGKLLIGYSTTLGDYEVLEELLEKHDMTSPKLLAESGYEREGNPARPVKFELYESKVREE